MSVLSCFPFRRRAKSVCCLRFIKLPLKNPFSTEFWKKNSLQTTVSKFSEFWNGAAAASISNSRATSWFVPCDFLRNKLPPKTQNAGGESASASAPKVLQLLFQIWVGMEINSGPPLNQTSAACRTVHPNCVISSGKRCPTVVGENKKLSIGKVFHIFSLFAHSREKVSAKLRENF